MKEYDVKGLKLQFAYLEADMHGTLWERYAALKELATHRARRLYLAHERISALEAELEKAEAEATSQCARCEGMQQAAEECATFLERNADGPGGEPIVPFTGDHDQRIEYRRQLLTNAANAIREKFCQDSERTHATSQDRSKS